MSVLDVIQAAAPKLGIARPTQLIADTGDTSLELQSTLIEVANQIRDRYDWSALKTLATITGDSATLAFSKPTDYSRMLKKATLWPTTTPYAPLTHYTDSDQWLGVLTQNFQPVVGAWTMLGGQINIRMGGNNAPLASGASVYAHYITQNVFADNAAVPKATVTADSDVFRLDERLLKLGLIAQWKANKGRPNANDQSDFEDALAVAIGADKGDRTLVMGAQRVPAGVEFALPWPVLP